MGKKGSIIGQASATINENQFPNINVFLHKPIIVEPPLCSLRELQDGTYSIDDLFLMHELMDLKQLMKGK